VDCDCIVIGLRLKIFLFFILKSNSLYLGVN
jgi:hypothetical protein